jgi:large subunit ribosomal protein L19
MKNKYLTLVEGSNRDDLPKFEIGDTVDVHVRILEGNKERVQVFNGTVIARRGEGVERIFPVTSPKIAKVEVKRSGEARRAKLFYLRDRVGKKTKLKERKAKVDVNAAPSTNGAAKGKKGKKATTEAAAE